MIEPRSGVRNLKHQLSHCVHIYQVVLRRLTGNIVSLLVPRPSDSPVFFLTDLSTLLGVLPTTGETEPKTNRERRIQADGLRERTIRIFSLP